MDGLTPDHYITLTCH